MNKTATNRSNSDTSVTTSEEADELPIALQGIITQTDRSGNQIRVARPSQDAAASRNSNLNSQQSTLRRLLCCFRGSPNSGELYSSGKPQRTMSKDYTQASPNYNRFHQQNSFSRPMPLSMPNMGEVSARNRGRKCLALDLDETLVHSSFQPVDQAHYIIPVTIDGIVHNVFVIKRPGVDEFMRRMGEIFEVVIYTASLSKYADPLLDVLDIHKVIFKRLFRENCVYHEGNYVKDLSLLNREITQTIIVDNSPMSYKFHQENAIDCGTFIDDPADLEMWQIADFLESIKDCDDVRLHCRKWREWCSLNPSSAPVKNL